MSILLHSGMRLNLATGQVFLTQNTNLGSSSNTESNQNTEEEVGTTAGAEGENTGGESETEAEGTVAEGEGETGTEGEGETGTETTGVDGEAGLNGETMDGTVEGTQDFSGIDAGMYVDGNIGMDTGAGTGVKDPLLSNWFFVGGISAATLVVSIVLGILLAKKRIKKGIHLYED